MLHEYKLLVLRMHLAPLLDLAISLTDMIVIDVLLFPAEIDLIKRRSAGVIASLERQAKRRFRQHRRHRFQKRQNQMDGRKPLLAVDHLHAAIGRSGFHYQRLETVEFPSMRRLDELPDVVEQLLHLRRRLAVAALVRRDEIVDRSAIRIGEQVPDRFQVEA